MKNKLWLFQLPFVAICTFALYVSNLGVEGRIENRFLRETLFSRLRDVSTSFSDFKFRLRGPQAPKNKVVIVEVDNQSIEAVGRWPWHRDATSLLVESVMNAGAKVVGLDIVFSEPDKRVPEQMADVLGQDVYKQASEKMETDPLLANAILRYRDRLVLGWVAEETCQPLYDGAESCAPTHPDVVSQFPKNYSRFGYSIQQPENIDATRTPLISVMRILPNLPDFSEMAMHAGYFNAFQDPDGYIRRMNLLLMLNGRAYPSLPLEMARIGLGERLSVSFDSGARVEDVRFTTSGRSLTVSPVGAMEANFRGKARTFQYISALDVLRLNEPEEKIQPQTLAEGAPSAPASPGAAADRAPAAAAPAIATASDSAQGPLSRRQVQEMLKDAYVLIGLSAIGVYDMRAFPFDSNTPGVEGHATLLDNILSNDYLTSGAGLFSSKWLYFLMIVGGIAFAYAAQRLESLPGLLLAVGTFTGFSFFDVKVLFSQQINWNTSFFYIEMFLIFVTTVAAKYVIEERNKKFVRGAFAKYVAPAVVDSILKDPTKLTVGGEKRDLTILFSDIRGFTTFSEKMDAKALSSFLNDYLGIQTKIVFAHEGTLDKYIGDAIMAFWGAPLDQPKHAYNACKAAVAMMRALYDNKQRFKEQYGVDVEIGIGLNSGTVSVGNMGSNDNFAYTVIGDHVNLASRLEGLTKYYGAGIVTSRFTFDAIMNEAKEAPLPHRTLDMVKVKGKKNAVELIQVLDRDLPESGLKIFEEARQHYLKQEWDSAIEKFQKASALLGKGDLSHGEKDGPSEMYLERIEEIRQNPPGADWDGTWEMHSK